MPVCLEGALKLKEISYIPTDSYAAGEMKHGPIALLDEDTPGRRRDERLARARQGRLERAGGARPRRPGDRRRSPRATRTRRTHADWVLAIPRTAPELAPILASMPLQILAYRIARLRGLPIDQPRNLAKTVTVE